LFDANIMGVTDKLKFLIRFYGRATVAGDGTNIIAGVYECRVLKAADSDSDMVLRIYNPRFRKQPTKPSIDVSESDVGYRCVEFRGRPENLDLTG
jgi:hypothetical protein